MNDKTKRREKLAASIRMSRENDQNADRKKKTSPDGATTGDETVSIEVRSPTYASKRNEKENSLKHKRYDRYQSGRRIWPD